MLCDNPPSLVRFKCEQSSKQMYYWFESSKRLIYCRSIRCYLSPARGRVVGTEHSLLHTKGSIIERLTPGLLVWIQLMLKLSGSDDTKFNAPLKANYLQRKLHWKCFTWLSYLNSVTSKKSPNVYKSCPKRTSLVKWKILTTLQQLPKMCWQFRQNNCCPGLWKVSKV